MQVTILNWRVHRLTCHDYSYHTPLHTFLEELRCHTLVANHTNLITLILVGEKVQILIDASPEDISMHYKVNQFVTDLYIHIPDKSLFLVTCVARYPITQALDNTYILFAAVCARFVPIL